MVCSTHAYIGIIRIVRLELRDQLEADLELLARARRKSLIGERRDVHVRTVIQRIHRSHSKADDDACCEPRHRGGAVRENDETDEPLSPLFPSRRCARLRPVSRCRARIDSHALAPSRWYHSRASGVLVCHRRCLDDTDTLLAWRTSWREHARATRALQAAYRTASTSYTAYGTPSL